MIGTTLSHFKITAKLGEGGMGEVYLAEDTKLGRDVALKVLPEEMASDPDRLERFQREAKTIAALSHPNIVTLFSVEEAEGIHFLTMELVEGKTLDALIPSDGLSLERLFELATPIVDAVASAHARGIVHRDLKPTNVMVTDEDQRVKVLDFGLAKLAAGEAADGSTELPTEALTREGIVVGTPHYMSPEQAKGETVDQRSDIFSLGVMLFEMATGRRPFLGASSIELLSAVLRDTPPPVTEVKPELPRHLARVIGRCLEKAPADRYQSPRDVAIELRGLQRETDSGEIAPAKSPRQRVEKATAELAIGVLPFTCPTDDQEMATLAEGLSEDLTTGLARFSFLTVASGSAEAGSAVDLRRIAEILGVRYLLHGRIRRVGPAFRVGVHLTDATTGARLWAETFDRNLDDATLFEMQDELTDRIVGIVADGAGVLARSMATTIRKRPIEELTADEWVFRAFAHMQQLKPEEHAQLRDGLEKVTESEPDRPDGWGWLSMLYLQEYQHQLNPRPDSLARALSAAQRSVELDPACQVGRVHLASVYFHQRDLGAFLPAAERAIALNPRDTHFVGVMGMMIAFSGEWGRGLEIVRKAMELNPHHPGWLHFVPFYVHFQRGEFEAALRVAKLIQMPDFQWTWYVIGAATGQLGRTTEAREAVERLKALGIETLEQARTEVAKWIYEDSLLEDLLDGLRKAGLNGASSPAEPDPAAPESPPDSTDSSGPEPSSRLDPRVVAVLPFDNLSGAEAADFLATGLHNDLVTELSRVAGLTIISRTSVMRYQQTDKTVRMIGRELNAGTVIEGTVQSAGNRVRLTAQLIDANEDVQRWAERYDRELSTETLFDLQSEVTKKIVDSLQSELAPTLEIPSTKPQTQDMEAYRLCTLGRVQVERRTKTGCLRAIEHFENAVERDPDYAPAWTGLADALAIAVWYGYLEPGDRLQRAEKAALRAVELDPDSAEAHCALATSLGALRKGPEAMRELELAVRLQPSYGEAQNRLSYLNKLHGRARESLDWATRAVETNPLSAESVSNLALSLVINGSPQDALSEAQRASELSPGWTTATLYEALALYELGRFREAEEALRDLTVEWAGLGAQAQVALTRVAAGDEGSARQVLAAMESEVDPFAIGLVHLALGEIEAAFQKFSESEKLNDWACLSIHHLYRDLWAPVADDPRYQELVRRAYEAHNLDPSNPL